jgi:hypothetical protein
MTDPEDFYVPDEPVGDVRAAFERGKKGKTRRPVSRGAVADAQARRLVVNNPFGKLVVAWGTTASAAAPSRFGVPSTAAPSGTGTPIGA